MVHPFRIRCDRLRNDIHYRSHFERKILYQHVSDCMTSSILMNYMPVTKKYSQHVHFIISEENKNKVGLIAAQNEIIHETFKYFSRHIR
jgi:hypothetical protein